VSRRESRPSGARAPAKNPHRTAAFREAARAIVYKDRYDRKSGFSVDTAGSIARALEKAYAQGFVDAQEPSPATTGCLVEADRNFSVTFPEPIEWILIPPRTRGAFWKICLCIFGRGPATTAKATGYFVCVQTPRGTPGWQLVTGSRTEGPFRHTTIQPLLRLGLLDSHEEPGGRRLVISELGRLTWQRFVERGGQFPDDLTSPSDSGDTP